MKAKSSTSVSSQATFNWKLMTRIFEDRLIVNIDEHSYGRPIINNYSWISNHKILELSTKCEQ